MYRQLFFWKSSNNSFVHRGKSFNSNKSRRRAKSFDRYRCTDIYFRKSSNKSFVHRTKSSNRNDCNFVYRPCIASYTPCWLSFFLCQYVCLLNYFHTFLCLSVYFLLYHMFMFFLTFSFSLCLAACSFFTLISLSLFLFFSLILISVSFCWVEYFFFLKIFQLSFRNSILPRTFMK